MALDKKLKASETEGQVLLDSSNEEDHPMDDDKLLPHVENLVPGFVTLLLILLCPPQWLIDLHLEPKVAQLLGQSALAALFTTATAYLLGVVAFVASRFLVDPLSNWLFRPIVIRIGDWKHFRGWPGIRTINDEYHDVLQSVLSRPEIESRRRRGRLIRTALFPAIFLSWGAERSFLWTGLAALGVVALYAYAEFSVYSEARLIQRAREKEKRETSEHKGKGSEKGSG